MGLDIGLSVDEAARLRSDVIRRKGGIGHMISSALCSAETFDSHSLFFHCSAVGEAPCPATTKQGKFLFLLLFFIAHLTLLSAQPFSAKFAHTIQMNLPFNLC